MKLDLKDITICAVDSVNVALTARALERSMTQCSFADAILFSDQPVKGTFRTEKIEKINSTAEYSFFCWKVLPQLVQTRFVLIVQWDGYVVNPGAWKPIFRTYDYIGARWPSVSDALSVGNGGFSLRSRKFLSALAGSRFALDPSKNSDWVACRMYRPILAMEYGIRFAPPHVADRFSHENAGPNGPTFGFHGLGNMWRYLDDAELLELIDDLHPYVLETAHYTKLILECFMRGRDEALIPLYARIRSRLGKDQILQKMALLRVDGDIASQCISKCENHARSCPGAFSERSRLA
jgi:hypothetical protein